jgi:hypothetical protein
LGPTAGPFYATAAVVNINEALLDDGEAIIAIGQMGPMRRMKMKIN